jgi:hypothetical protein
LYFEDRKSLPLKGERQREGGGGRKRGRKGGRKEEREREKLIMLIVKLEFGQLPSSKPQFLTL